MGQMAAQLFIATVVKLNKLSTKFLITTEFDYKNVETNKLLAWFVIVKPKFEYCNVGKIRIYFLLKDIVEVDQAHNGYRAPKVRLEIRFDKID